jgi:NADPH-dependent ferric siderophore reductase
MDGLPLEAQAPVIERLRMEPVRRTLTVRNARRITPQMLRVTLEGGALAGFVSPSPDDHIKVFFTTPEGGKEGRDYTPRSFDLEARTLTVDFALHDGGVGARWAESAKPGDNLEIGGPRGSTVISSPWWLLVGDETALPSVGRRLEEIPSGTRVISILAVTGPEEEQVLSTKSLFTPHWIHRPSMLASDPAPFLRALSNVKLPSGPGLIWVAAEEQVSRAVREYAIDVLRHPVEWIKASAYWTKKLAP